MDTGERLAAYLSGDLDPDERTAVEAELAGDASLRALLDDLVAVDQALAGLGDLDPPPGFSEALRAAVAPHVRDVLGDELAARRARRHVPRWVTGAAAAALVAAVAAVGLPRLLGTKADEGADSTAEMAAGAMPDVAELGYPVIEAGRSFDESYLTTLTQGGLAFAAPGPEDAANGTVTRESQETGPAPLTSEATDDGATAQTPEEIAPAAPPAPLSVELIARCVDTVLADAAEAEPLYVERGTYHGEDVLAVVLRTRGADGERNRTEVWVLETADCEVRYFAQHDT